MRYSRGITSSALIIGMFLLLFFYAIGPSPLLAYEVVSVTQGGELLGSIKYKGEAPVNQSHPVNNNPDFCGSTVQEETFIVNPDNKGLENVVISIQGVQSGMKPPSPTLVIENRHCHFVPHLQAAMVGDSYEIRNADPVLHNTHLHLEETTLMNVAMPPGGKNIKKTLSQAGVVNVRCDAHKFMHGWLLVFDNPYFAVTDKDGNFEIKNVPAGHYTLKTWSEDGKPATQSVDVAASGATVELTVKK